MFSVTAENFKREHKLMCSCVLCMFCPQLSLVSCSVGPAAPPCIFPAPGRRCVHGTGFEASPACSCGRAPQTWRPAAAEPAEGSGNLECPQSAGSIESADWTSEP